MRLVVQHGIDHPRQTIFRIAFNGSEIVLRVWVRIKFIDLHIHLFLLPIDVHIVVARLLVFVFLGIKLDNITLLIQCYRLPPSSHLCGTPTPRETGAVEAFGD